MIDNENNMFQYFAGSSDQSSYPYWRMPSYLTALQTFKTPANINIFNTKKKFVPDLDKIAEKYNDNILLYSSGFSSKENKRVYYSLLLKFSDTILLDIKSDDRNMTFYTKNITDKDRIQEIFNEIEKDYTKPEDEVEESYIYLVNFSDNCFNTMKFKINKINLDLSVNYNDDFIKVNTRIEEVINNQKKGLILLHGAPGTGKTSYIRYLVTKFPDRKIIYIPSDMTNVISKPEFVTLMSNNANSILIIEDAENILTSRNQNRSQAITNILNLSDGLLSDCFNIQIICTFNTDLKNLDEALLRKGRMLVQYEFKALNPLKTANLAKSLGVTISDSKTLAEIYNAQSESYEKEKKHLGFRLTEEVIPAP